MNQLINRRRFAHTALMLGALLILTLAGCTSVHETPSVTAKASTIYLVRHTEKAKDGTRDPALTAAGLARAAYLAEMVRDTPLHKVMSTDYQRTRSTAQAFAEQANLSVELYSPDNFDVRAFAHSIAGKNAVIVGHSNTIPGLVNDLLREDRYSDQDESDYDTFFVVSLYATSATAVRLHLPYPTPTDSNKQ